MTAQLVLLTRKLPSSIVPQQQSPQMITRTAKRSLQTASRGARGVPIKQTNGIRKSSSSSSSILVLHYYICRLSAFTTKATPCFRQYTTTTTAQKGSSACLSTSYNRIVARSNKATVRFSSSNSSSSSSSSSSSFTSWCSSVLEGLGINPFIRWYTRYLDEHPVVTKCLSAGFLAFTGDLVSQTIIRKYVQASQEKEQGGNNSNNNSNSSNQAKSNETNTDSDGVDWARTARFAGMNVFFVGPILHVFYTWLATRYPVATFASAVKKVIWDEFIFTPIYLPIFLSALWTLEGLEWETIQSRLVNKVPSMLVFEWSLHIPAQLLNFRFVPPKYQVLFVNSIGFVWNAFLSTTANNNNDEDQNHGPVAANDKEQKQQGGREQGKDENDEEYENLFALF